MLNLVTTCRHGKGITIIAVCHAIKTILTPAIRGMIDFLFVGAFTNRTLIKKHLFEENCSMMISENEFMEEYKEKIINGEYNFIFINGKCKYTFNVNKWSLSTFDRNTSIKKGAKVKIVNINTNFKIKEKIKDKNEIKKLENQYLWKPEKDKNNGNIQIKFKKSRK